MHKYFILLILLAFAGCKKKATEPDITTVSKIIVEGNIQYKSFSTMIQAVGAPIPTDGYYLLNRQWVSRVSDTCSYTLLTGNLSSIDFTPKVIVIGEDSIKVINGSLGTLRMMQLKVNSIQTLE